MANIFTLENIEDFSEKLNIDELYNGGKSLAFIGTLGTGKTFAATSILKKALVSSYSAYYANMSDIISSILDTKDGTFIKTFTYRFEAKEYLQKEYQITSSPEIGSVLNGSKKSSLGFVFKYKEI